MVLLAFLLILATMSPVITNVSAQEESIELEPVEYIEAGLPVFVIGHITPPVQGETIEITYTAPSGTSASRNVTTEIGGTFFDNTYVPREIGNWTVTSKWIRSTPDEDLSTEPQIFEVNKVVTEIRVFAERLNNDPSRLSIEAILRTTALLGIRNATLQIYQDGQPQATKQTNEQGQAFFLITVEGVSTTVEIQFEGTPILEPANAKFTYSKPLDVTGLLIVSSVVGFAVVGIAIAVFMYRGRRNPEENE
jgi:hypothetical protein